MPVRLDGGGIQFILLHVLDPADPVFKRRHGRNGHTVQIEKHAGLFLSGTVLCSFLLTVRVPGAVGRDAFLRAGIQAGVRLACTVGRVRVLRRLLLILRLDGFLDCFRFFSWISVPGQEMKHGEQNEGDQDQDGDQADHNGWSF